MNDSAFCDYLGCSFPPDDSPLVDVEQIVSELGGYRADDGTGSMLWRFPESTGTVKYQENRRFAFVGVSGAVCALLRASEGAWLELLSTIGSGPHKVTGMHLAKDLPVSGADYVVPLKEKFPHHVYLTRKAVRTRVLLEQGDDGRETGSFFAGNRRVNKVSALVYDKRLESLAKRGEFIDPTTRVEVRLKGDCVAPGQGMTLRDAVLCDPAFYHYASPNLIDRPASIPAWVPGVDLNWSASWSPPDPLVRLERMVWAFPELKRWVEIADGVPGGRAFLLRQLAMRVNSYHEAVESPEVITDG